MHLNIVPLHLRGILRWLHVEEPIADQFVKLWVKNLLKFFVSGFSQPHMLDQVKLIEHLRLLVRVNVQL